MLVLLDIYLLIEGKQKYVQVSSVSASKYDGAETEISWKKETKTNNLGNPHTSRQRNDFDMDSDFVLNLTCLKIFYPFHNVTFGSG